MYNIIFKVLQYSNFFPTLEFLGPRDPPPGGLGNPEPQKPQVGNNTPTFIFDIFKIIGIRNCPYILHIFLTEFQY